MQRRVARYLRGRSVHLQRDRLYHRPALPCQPNLRIIDCDELGLSASSQPPFAYHGQATWVIAEDGMERRLGLRGLVDLPVIQHVDGFPHECRVVDISARGLVVQRTKSLASRRTRLLYWLELPLLDGEGRRIHALARPVWTQGALQAMRYVTVNEVDQLEIAELLDRLGRRGTTVLH
jgi:hypothetical protein